MSAIVSRGSSLGHQALNDVLDSIVLDLATIRTAVNVAISKLNADGGVSDTNYAAITTLGTTSD